MASTSYSCAEASGQKLTEAEANDDFPAPTPKLGESSDLFLRMIDHLPDLICIKDTAGRYVFNNQAHVEFLGASTREELAGRSEQDFFPAELAKQYAALDQSVLQSGQPQCQHQEPTRTRAGKRRWLLTTRIPLADPNGTFGALLCVSQDITERKKAEKSLHHVEALYRTLIEGLPQRVFFKDPQSAFVSVNAVFAKDLGMKPKDLIGKTDFDLFSHELAAKYRADDLRVMQQRRPEILEEVNVSKGTRRIVEVVKVPVLDGQDELLGLLGIFTDITERKNAEAKLQAFAAQLQRSNRELQDFAYVASHDLQEPLRKVAVFGSRLQAKCGAALGQEGLDYLERMLKATTRMQVLINDLLSFARVTTQAKPFTLVNLTEVANEVIGDLEARLEQVEGKVEAGPLPILEADPLQMRQLFQNLIGNALKFRRPEAPPVVKLTSQISPNADFCHLTIEDNGIGFEDKYTNRIFQVFQRLHNRNEYEGSGIGLAICRKIVERHGGTITAHGDPGRSATFLIQLPLYHLHPDHVS